MDYGIGINFYNDKEIRIQYYENIKRKGDKFLNIREIYDFYTNKDIAVHFICDYVKKIARETFYADMTTGVHNNYYSKLMEVIRDNPGDFYSFCHKFTNTEQIREWIIEILHCDDSEKIIENPINKGKLDKSIVFR